MKPQQRKFIVEVKSARRRSTIRPSSIWGDTDLKALVREAETAAPHLFETANGARSLGPEQSIEVRTHDGARADDVAPIADPVAVPEETRAIQDASNSASISVSEENYSTTTRPKVSKRHRPARRVSRTRSGTSVAATEVTLDDLAAFEEENRRLKALLVQHLQQENTQLRRMLERFASN